MTRPGPLDITDTAIDGGPIITAQLVFAPSRSYVIVWTASGLRDSMRSAHGSFTSLEADAFYAVVSKLS